MRKVITALLLAATAATPVLAQEPDAGDGRPHVERGGDRRDGGAQRPQPQEQRPQQAPQPQPQRAQQAQQPQQQRAPQAQPQPQPQRDRMMPSPEQRGQAYQPGPGRDGRGFDGNRQPQQQPQQQQAQPRPGGDPRDGREGYRNDRRDGGRPAQGFREDPRFGGPQGNDRAGYDRGRDDRGGAWSRNWRQDQRYDWQRYRAQNRSIFRLPRYYAPNGYTYRRFAPGYRIAPLFFDQRYWIADPWSYRLPYADYPYEWVRYFDDVLLVDVRSGTVVDVIPDFFFY